MFFLMTSLCFSLGFPMVLFGVLDFTMAFSFRYHFLNYLTITFHHFTMIFDFTMTLLSLLRCFFNGCLCNCLYKGVLLFEGFFA